MRRQFLLIPLAVTVIGYGQTQPARVEVKIDKISRDEYGLKATVSVRNVGDQTVVFGTDGNETLRSLDIQQHDSKVGWESVGYCNDVPPVCCVSLQPRQTITNVIPLVDPKGRVCCGVCGRRKLRFLRGPVRAVLYYGYASKRDFQNPLHSTPIVLNATSATVALPAN